jgi:hypothetical protein
MIRFFGTGGGTQLLAKNKPCVNGLVNASLDKAAEDTIAQKVRPEEIAYYIATLGLASGLTLGIYLMAEVFGLSDQMLDGAAFTEADVRAMIDSKRAKEQFKIDPSGN